MIPLHLFFLICLLLFVQDDCTPPEYGELSEYTEVKDLFSRYTNGLDVHDQWGTTQDDSILPAPPVGRLPISQDRLDRVKLVCDSISQIILPSGKNILADVMFKIIIGCSNLGTRQIQSRLGSKVCLFIALMPVWLSTHKKSSFYWQNLKRHFRITIPIKGCSSFIHCKVWRQKSESITNIWMQQNI